MERDKGKSEREKLALDREDLLPHLQSVPPCP